MFRLLKSPFGGLSEFAAQLKLLHSSPLFDPFWYRRVYADVGSAPLDYAHHYLDHGAAEGRNPHPLFDTNYYLVRNPDVAAAGINPLVHYILFGGKEGRDPHPHFDTAFYLQQCALALGPGLEETPLQHYILYGTRLGLRGHPVANAQLPQTFHLTWWRAGENAEDFGANSEQRERWLERFDREWYVKRNPDVAASSLSPFAHFIKHGLSEGRAPNPAEELRSVWSGRFNADWYTARNDDVAPSGFPPLEHFIEFGIRESRAPNSQEESRAAWQGVFDSTWYLERNPDVAQSEIDPLEHYLTQGILERRLPNGETQLKSRPVTDAEITCIKRPKQSAEVALFVTHSPDGGLKPHVYWYVDALTRGGISVVLIVASDVQFRAAEKISYRVNGLFVRENQGFDFAAWAHVLKLHPEFLDCKILYLINDSVLGPTNDMAFAKLISRLRASDAALVGLTENIDRGWHIQSYFLSLKQKALSSPGLRQFLDAVVSFERKDDVVNEYETRLAQLLRVAGLNCEVLFPTPGASNPTLFRWKELLVLGFPFLKVATAREDSSGVNKAGWRDFLAAQGYEASLADRNFAAPAIGKSDVGVIYLARGADLNCFDSFKRFLTSYRSFVAGTDHHLFVVLKGFNSELELERAKAMFAGDSVTLIHTDDSGFDIGAYIRVAKEIRCEYVCFLNSYSEILADNWLQKLMDHARRPEVGLVGATGSLETRPDDSVGQTFPNTHLRSNAFMIRRELFICLLKHKEIREKSDAYSVECGSESLTRQVIARGLKVLIVGRDGRGYPPQCWRSSRTFRLADQGNLLIGDNHTRVFSNVPTEEKKVLAELAWGKSLTLENHVPRSAQ